MSETTHPFAQRLRQVPDSRLLYADQPTGTTLMCMPEVEKQTEHCLIIEHGDSADRGMLTGALGGVLGPLSLFMALSAYADQDMGSVLRYVLIALASVLIPFIWEILRPMPLPILLNRRTREIYFEQDGELYHTPWDGIAAAAHGFATVGLYTGGMRHAALEALLHRFGHPGEQVLINLGSPLGKSLEMQLGFWEYLRAYMDNGPWFDEHGNHSESDAFNKSLVEANQKTGEAISLYWGRIRSEYQANGGRNYLSYTHFMLLIGSILLLPLDALQNLTYRVAKRSAPLQWPALIRERLRPDGPTTRLVDLEQAKS
jgi:hypothetical protein